MSITTWPDDERPREKLLQRGAAALSDAELLAIFLRIGAPGISAVDLARDLLKQHGGLRTLLGLDQAEFCATRGLGPAKYVQLQAVLELARRYLEETLQRGDAIQSVADTHRYLMAKMRHHPHEVFAVLFLDNKHRVIQYEELFFGTIDSSSVHPRQVVKRALYHNAAAVIVAHNHPSGVAEPSRADELITLRLKEALALLDVRLLDHVVVGDGDVVSLAARGVI
ncbi:MAG: DNA repair protein RadC [Candidatus Competibacter denitrificans]|jgi:DNA repair protein RadC|uniref:Associated with replication fork, DNA repair protein n=1 Tax=Candidatus Competibacter denitrificans Run_A_D11 TaxID=1400863 RepID=W6ME16_9GAMM|nr:DNA repair protein RadC [Candidatus Competibacter denitrificans]CDI03828.1 putative associated with replication fork, DNA repair protein [Candidatus Competibacter denitrificans Run_A_D11]HAS85226.1 JAB domain-containing protein [Candidatus Competibacteraceae bacterium]HRC68798.1 DNA repair protein RadC [Candidatus Competibacter denitrificans]